MEELKKTQVLPPDYISYLYQQLYLIYLTYGYNEGMPFQDFRTDDFHCGNIVLLEKGDDPADLGVVGLRGGFYQTIVECVERVRAGQIELYRILVMYDNDFIMTFLMEASIYWDARFNAWLQEESQSDYTETFVPISDWHVVPF